MHAPADTNAPMEIESTSRIEETNHTTSEHDLRTGRQTYNHVD
jgi:hypothetical protein